MAERPSPVPTSLQDAALGYAARGWPVLPVRPGRKVPLIKDWPNVASTDPDTLRAWWQATPDANVGIVTGDRSGIWALDLDGTQGVADLDVLMAKYGALPATRVVCTPSGGGHYYFAMPAGVTIGNRTKIDRRSIDARGTGGFVVAPPSRTAKGDYMLAADVPIADAPQWLLDLVVRRETPLPPDEPLPYRPTTGATVYERAVKYVAAMPAAIAGHGGHAATFAVARACYTGFGLSVEETEQLLREEYNPRCVPPWSVVELRHKAQSAADSPSRFPRGYLMYVSRAVARGTALLHPEEICKPASKPTAAGLPGVPKQVGRPIPVPQNVAPRLVLPDSKPFPWESLPDGLREYVIEIGESVDCDPSMAVGPALVLAGAAVGAAVVISPKRRYREPPCLWVATVADSGTGKSPAAKPTVDIAFEINQDLKRAYNRDLAQYLKELEAYQAQDDPDPCEKPAKPVREHFVFVDATIERISEMAGASPRGLILYRDELTAWFNSFTRYKGQTGGSDVANWLSMFDCGPISYHRRTGEPRDVEVERAFVSVCGGIQPGILSRVFQDQTFIESGLMARILFIMPPKSCPRWSESELSESTERRFRNLIDRLRAIPFDPVTGPGVILLSPDAKKRFRALNDEFALDCENEDGPLAAALPKAVRYALRLALIHHLVELADKDSDPIGSSINDRSMQAGEAMARWFIHEASRVIGMLTESGEDRELRRLYDWAIRQGGTVSVRDLSRSNGRKYPRSEQAELALDFLVEAGLADWVSERPKSIRIHSPVRHCPTASDTSLE